MNPKSKRFRLLFMLNIIMIAFAVACQIKPQADIIKSTENNGYFIHKTEYTNYQKGVQIDNIDGFQQYSNAIKISYPKIYGFSNNVDVDTINRLIEIDIKKVMLNSEIFYENNLVYEQEFVCVFLSDGLLSIFYKGWYGTHYNPGRGYEVMVIGTTIDIANEKIVALSDIVIDPNALYDSLQEGRFEAISTWEGVKGGYSIEMNHSGISREDFIEALKPQEFDIANHRLEWYTDGENFVIVILNNYYYEYSARIEDVESLLRIDKNDRAISLK